MYVCMCVWFDFMRVKQALDKLKPLRKVTFVAKNQPPKAQQTKRESTKYILERAP